MATNQPMSNPSDWIFQPYQNEFSLINQIETSPANTLATADADSSRNNNLRPEQGRDAKPIRRRWRTSRRTPTTLLNTDTTNFRAMVQHFTGGPAGGGQQIPNAGAAFKYLEHMAAAPAGFRVQFPDQVQHMFMMDNVHGDGAPLQAPPGSGNSSNYDRFMV